MESEEAYFARRAEEERAAADRSQLTCARRVHLELARAYAQRAAAARQASARSAAGERIVQIRPEASA